MDLLTNGVTMIVIIAVAILVLFLIVFITKYKTVGPDEALIVSGSYLGRKNVFTDEGGKRVKIVRGGGTFVMPVFQQSSPLSLLSSKLEVRTPEIYTEQGVPVTADGTAIIKIGGSISEIATAAEQFLGKTTQERENEAIEVVEGHLRAILGSMTVEEIYKNRDKFSQEVQGVATQDLSKMGLIIVSFTLKEVRDNNGYLDALGKPRIAQVKRDADVAEAEATKETRMKRAEAEKEATRAELERKTEIAEAEKQNQLKVAEYRSEQETAKAIADQAYDLESARSKQEVIEQQMQVQIIEREKQIELEDREIKRRERQYDAEVKKKADADRYSIEQAAAARKSQEYAEAEANQYRIETLAKAEAEQVRVQGIAKADAERAQGTAAAEVIKLQGLAEAEAKRKIAEAYELYGQAAMLDMIVSMLPEYAKQVAAPMGNIDSITVVDTGSSESGGGANKVSGYATNLMATAQESLKATTGLDIRELLENFSGKGNVKSSIEDLTDAVKSQKPVEVVEVETLSENVEEV